MWYAEFCLGDMFIELPHGNIVICKQYFSKFIAAGDASFGNAHRLLSTHLWRHKAVFVMTATLWRHMVRSEGDFELRRWRQRFNRTPWQISLEVSYFSIRQDMIIALNITDDHFHRKLVEITMLMCRNSCQYGVNIFQTTTTTGELQIPLLVSIKYY